LSRTAGPAFSSSDIDRRISRAVDASEARQTAKTVQLVHDLAQRAESEHSLRLVAEEEAKFAKERQFAMEKSSGDLTSPPSN
jgi:hypothetical protein